MNLAFHSAATNEVSLAEFCRSNASRLRRPSSFFEGATAYLRAVTSDGRLLFRIVAVSLMGVGGFALVQSATGLILPHDLGYLRMTMPELCGLGGGRVARFMFHDRVSFGGALIAIGFLYLWLE